MKRSAGSSGRHQRNMFSSSVRSSASSTASGEHLLGSNPPTASHQENGEDLLESLNNSHPYDSMPQGAQGKAPLTIDTANGEDGPSLSSSSAESYPHGPMYCLEVPFLTRAAAEGGVSLIQKEATGQGMACAARGVLHTSATFFGPALLQLATMSAQDSYCAKLNLEDDDQKDNCDLSAIPREELRVFGTLHPSSILTISSSVATIVTALLLPLVGALIDRSHHRKSMGKFTALALVAINFLQIGLSPVNWPFFWFCHGLTDVLYLSFNMVMLAYMQNLSTNPKTLSIYSSQFSVVQFVCMMLYMVTMIVYARATEDSILGVSRVAHMISSTIGGVWMAYCWTYLFQERGPRRQFSSPNVTVFGMFRESVASLHETYQRVRYNYPALKWMLFTILWSPAVGAGTYFAMFATLQKSLIQMSGSQIGLCNLLALTCTIAGARISSCVCDRVNALYSFRMSVLLFAMTFAGIAIFITGPEAANLYFGCSAMIGLTLGWFYPTERVLFCTLSPLGQEAEIMSVILCFQSAAAWIPPLVFSAVNEAGYSLRWAVASQVFLLALGLLVSFGIGDYDKAVAEVRRTPPRSEDDEALPCAQQEES